MTTRPIEGHVSDDDLVLHFYGEAEQAVAIEQHLRTCTSCRGSLDELTRVLALVDTHQAPDPGPGFERTVWARLSPALEPPPRHGWVGVLVSRWGLSGAAAALLLIAFAAGRWSQDIVAPASEVAALDSAAAERVLVVAVGDHLDRSQMVLLEILNSDLQPASFDAERERARDLVAANRLYRQSAEQSGDQATSTVLDELERVLLEIANAPDEATPEALESLQTRIQARGLLFKVRVFHSEMRERERQAFTTRPGPET